MPTSVHPHPDLEHLLAACAPLLDEARASQARSGGVPRPLAVVVPAGQFADWLQVRLARLQGICMGLEFVRPQEFVRRIADLAPNTSPPALDPWNRDSLAWFLLPHIPSVAVHLGLPGDQRLTPREAFAAARQLADHFEHYGHSRPELIAAWSANRPAPMRILADNSFARGAENWQRELWLRVREDIQNSAIAAEHPALELNANAPAAAARGALLYPDLFVLGTGGLDPLLVRTLAQLSEAGSRVEVHVVLPTLGFLADFRSPSSRARLLKDDDGSLEAPGHPLVCSLGRHSIGSFLLLGQLDENYSHWPEPFAAQPFTAPPKRSHLAVLQAALRDTGDGDPAATCEAAREAVFFDKADHSIRIHACHGPRRELEVLRDELLRAFAELPDLRPEEVLVLCSDLDTYAPLVASVLAGSDPVLPVRVTELAASATDPLLDALASLLHFAQGRRPASGLLELLQLKNVQEKLGVSEEPRSLDQLLDWIRQSGLTSDFDRADRLARGLPDDEIGTWRFAKDRLLAGVLFGASPMAKDMEGRHVLPLSGALSADTGLQDRFFHWFSQLETHLRTWATETDARSWALRLSEAAWELLIPEDSSEKFAELNRLLEGLTQLPVSTPVDAGTIEDWLGGLLQARSATRTQMTGDICFGRFKQLTQLPCRVLAMVGMQDTAFPRRSRTPVWDLLQLSPERWDRNPRIEDRQLFLDALLTPGDRLILTASTLNVRSGKQEPFSCCVDELLRSLESSFCADTGEDEPLQVRNWLVCTHRLQPHAAEYFGEPCDRGAPALPRSFNTQAVQVARALKTVGQAAIPLPAFCVDVAESNTPAGMPTGSLVVTLDELTQFWSDPARAWVKSRGITLVREEEDDLELDRPPLALDTLGTWSVRNAILESLLRGEATAEHTHALLTANRRLPRAELGAHLWARLQPSLQRMAAMIQRIRLPERLQLDLSLDLDGRRISLLGSLELGEISGEQCLLLYRVGDYDKPRYRAQAWIRMLAASAFLGRPISKCIVDDKTVDEGGPVRRPGADGTQAAVALQELLRGMFAGLSHPLCHAPETSAAYAAKVDDSGSPDLELLQSAARQKWSPEGDFIQAEGDSPAASLAWRGRDPFEAQYLNEWHRWAMALSRPAARWYSN